MANYLKISTTDGFREQFNGFDDENRPIWFIPVSDSDGSHRGSHWSLSVVKFATNIALHYDTSLLNINVDNARMMAAKCALIRDVAIMFVSMEDTPAQSNGYDCGPLMCGMMEILVECLLFAQEGEPVDMSLSGFQRDGETIRQWMFDCYMEMRQ